MSSETAPRKTVSESRVELIHLMRPHDANFGGKVHGGAILSLMDEVAYACATRFAERYCVTVALDHVEFLAPIHVGDLVRMRAAVNSAGSTSMEVGVTVTSEDPRRPGAVRRTNRSFITMVALDDAGRPALVPGLVCETAEDRKWCCEARLRRDARKRFNQEIEAGVCRFEMADHESGV